MTAGDRPALPSRRVVAAVLAGALAVRVGVGVWRGEALLAEGNGLFYMDALARSLAGGDGYTVDGVENVFQQPGYVLLLAAGYAVVGATWKGALAANALVSTALVWLAMRVAGRLDPRAVLPAGLLAAVHPVLVWHGLGIADTTLFSLALVGWADAVLAQMRDDAWRHRLAGGAWIGVAFLTRPSLLPLLPVALAALWIARRAWRPVALTAVTWLVVGLALTVPWMVRTHALTGKAPLIGTHGPESVWSANSADSPRATELDSTYDAVADRHAGTEFDLRAFQVEVPPREAVRREEGFRRAATEWVRANPGTFAWMCAVRLGRIWDPRYHPTRRWDRPLRGLAWRQRVHAPTHGVVLLLALVGLVALWRRGERRPEVLALLALLGAYSLSHCVGAGYSRVRIPIDPLLVALAGCGAAALLSRRRAA